MRGINLIISIFFIQSAFANYKTVAEFLDCKNIRTLKSDKADEVSVYRCHDNTLTITSESYAQTKFLKSYEGKCAIYASAMVTQAYCGKSFNPNEAYELGYFSDYTPGVRVNTLQSSINRIFDEMGENCIEGSWKVHQKEDGYQFLNHALTKMNRKRTRYNKEPFIALVRTKGFNLHYAAVMNIYFVDNAQAREIKLRPMTSEEIEERSTKEPIIQKPKESFSKNQSLRVNAQNINRCRVAVNEGSKQRVYTCQNFLKAMNTANNIPGFNLVYSEYNYFIFE